MQIGFTLKAGIGVSEMGKRDENVTKAKKPIYKKWWFWLIVAIVVIIGATGNSESNSSTENKNETKTVAKKESIAAKKERLKKEAEEKAEAERVWKEAEEKAQAEKAAKEAAEKAEAEKQAAEKAAKEAADRDPNSYQALPYEEMARNGNNHKGEKLQITGTVIQVTDSTDGGATLRVATNGKYDDIYMVQISKNEWESHRLLENDVITFYGYVYGLYSYKSVMGGQITVPALIVKFY